MIGSCARKILSCLALAALPAFGYDIPVGEGTAAGVSDFYLAPGGKDRLVLKYASIPVMSFDARPGARKRTWQSHEATAMEESDGRIDVHHRNFLDAGAATLVFTQGRLRSFRREGDENRKAKDLAFLSAHPKRPPTLQQLWRPRSAERDKAEKASWWRDGARLRLGYFNPNAAGTLFAEIAALFAAFALVWRRCGVRLACLGASAAALVALILTGSRGSFIASILGIAITALVHFVPRLGGKRVLLGTMLTVLLGGVALFAVGKMTDGRFGANLLSVDEGNVQRLRCWAAAPEMMAVAPEGWGDEPGRAYCDWFQAPSDNHRLYYLVNSHLTWMVQYGRVFRCAYVSAWLMLFMLLFAFARRKTVQVALAVWSAFAVSLWFSTVGIFPTLWILPALCGGAVLVVVGKELAQGGSGATRRRLALLFAIAVVLGCLTVLALEAIGRRQADAREIPVACDGGTVRIGRGDVHTAIIRDDAVLAGDAIGSFGHELRDGIHATPDAGSVLVVNNPDELPNAVDRLVAAGRGAARYLKHRAKHLGDGAYCHARRTIFLSPPFAPDAVPYTLSSGSEVRLAIGEFAAQFDTQYGRERTWVDIVPGAELYIPGWISKVLEPARKEVP